MAPSGEPVAYQILDDIKTTLEAMTAGADYYYGLERVIIGEANGHDFNVFPSAAITMGRQQLEVGGSQLTDARVATMSLQVVAWLKTVDSPEKDVSRLLRDIDKALRVDIRRSNLAVITRVTDADPFYPVENDPFAGVILDVEVEYRTEHDDLNTVV